MSEGLPSIPPSLTGVRVADALLPENYRQAAAMLAELVAIDECKEWADRAEALRSYARQADDPTLLNHAMRVKARAVRRCGELLTQIEPGNTQNRGGGRNIREGTRPDVSRTEAARKAGMSPHQAKQATRVAAVPVPEFERAVEAANPPTVTALAEAGRQRRAPPPDAAADAPLTVRECVPALRSMARRVNEQLFDLDGYDAHEWRTMRTAVAQLSEAERDALRRAGAMLTKLMETDT